MRQLSDILTKKEYKDKTAILNTYMRFFVVCAFLFFLVCASMGEWKRINAIYAGLPKILTAGIIALAVYLMVAKPDTYKLKKIYPPTIVYMSFLLGLLLWSAIIWILNFSNSDSMIQGVSKIIFQTIAVFCAISTVYLFGSKAIDYFAIGLCITNALIMLLEIPNYGISESINSLITCIKTFGDVEGYARALEIHDLTFVFGQLVIYYAAFAPTDTKPEKKKRLLLFLLCTFFFIVGMKRIAIPAVVLIVLVAALFKNKKINFTVYIFLGLAWIAFFFVYIYLARTGKINDVMKAIGLNGMGREYLWQMASKEYTFSVTYLGKGFEYVDSIVAKWYEGGLINHPYPFHNDILKVFVELGFPGFIFWSVSQYIVIPIFWSKFAGEKVAFLYFCELSYMTATYLTDNTAFYFWSTISLRLIVMCYVFVVKEKEASLLKTPFKLFSKKELQDEIKRRMSED